MGWVCSSTPRRAPAGKVPAEGVDELVDPVIEVGEERAVHMVGRELGRHAIEERRVEVG